jgi:hypothetical protein
MKGEGPSGNALHVLLILLKFYKISAAIKAERECCRGSGVLLCFSHRDRFISDIFHFDQ